MTGSAKPTGPGGPFPGLVPFTGENADYFVGRERESRILADNLLARRICVVYGRSGTGKTSLIQAGLQRWLEELKPDPVQAVVCSGWASGAGPALRAALQATVAGQPRAQDLDALIRQAVKVKGGRLLIVLDQFEELFAAPGLLDEEFIEVLAKVGPEVKALIAIREDSLAMLDALTGDVPEIFDNLIQVEQLDLKVARRAIVEPLRVWRAETGQSVEIEDELIEKVLAGVRTEATDVHIQAPYLQLVMARLWSEREIVDDRTSKLKADTLERLKGVQGIIAGHVDIVFEAFSTKDRDRIEGMLSVLVDSAGRKVPRNVTELAKAGSVGEDEAARIASGMAGEARLLERVGDASYQLAHDALAGPVQEWQARWAARRAKRNELLRLTSIMLFVGALLVLATLTGVFGPLEVATVGDRFTIRGAEHPPHDVLIVKIDEESLHRLHEQWPISRSLEARAIDYIGDATPKVIADDIDFSGKNSANRELSSVIAGSAHHVVLAAETVAPGGQVEMLGEKDGLAEIGARAGYSQFRFETQGVIRHPVYEYDGLKSFATATVEVASGKPVSREGLEDSWINYYGPERTFDSVPFWKVIDGVVPKSFFDNKIVLIGLTTAARGRQLAWGAHNSEMSGVEVQANAIQTIRRGLPLKSSPEWLELILILLFALVPVLPRRRFRDLRVPIVSTLSTAVVYALVTVLAFAHGLVLPVVAPLAALLLAAFALILVSVVVRETPRSG